jgi:hypothetical protein
VISLSQPEKMRTGILTKKSSAAAVSSWGFSGYITVLPKESKIPVDKKEKKVEVLKLKQETKAEDC